VKLSRRDRSTVAPSLRQVSPAVRTWAVTLAILISGSLFASSFGVLGTAPEVSAQRNVVVATHAAGAPTAPSLPAEAANSNPR
jgi:hypothetical protein